VGVLVVLATAVTGCGHPVTSAPSGAGGTGPVSAPSTSPAVPVDLLPRFGPTPAPVPVVLAHASGQVAWAASLPTTAKVAFLTIDDGWSKDPQAAALLRAAHVPVTLFLSINSITDDPGYFSRLEALGAMIEDHTMTHPHLPLLSYGQQRRELCQSADLLRLWYGRRPVLFRPPYGEQDASTLRAAWSCGLTAGFGWKETVDRGIVRYQSLVHVIQPGDIILMHFRPAYVQDFIAALRAIKQAGLVPALLEDWVRVEPDPAV
jgi:peptidoglycan/xylan/chitin deacetylase (PgdA/CDA1 family)